MIVTVRGPGDAGFSVHVRQPFARIGCGRFAEVRLPLASLSACHLYLHATDAGIYCLGLSDSAPSGWLTPQAAAAIGPYRIKAAFDDEGPPPAAEAVDPRKKGLASGPAPRLKIRQRGSKSRPFEFCLDRPLTVIGRSFPSTLRIAHASVSPVHSAFYWNGESMWVIDLFGDRPTLLGRAPLDASLWRPGQTLALGDFQIRYVGPPRSRAAQLFGRRLRKRRPANRDLAPAANQQAVAQQQIVQQQITQQQIAQLAAAEQATAAPLAALETSQSVDLQSLIPPLRDLLGLGRGAVQADDSVRLMEEELSSVSLTLVKVRQRFAVDRGPTSAEIGRLTEAIHGLEQRLAQLVETCTPAAAPSDAGHEPPRLADRPESPPVPATTVGDAPPRSVAPRREPAVRPQPGGGPTLLFDDDSFRRLVKFSNRELLGPHRKFWRTAATAAAIFVLFVAVAGAAKFWLHERPLDGHAGAQPQPAESSSRLPTFDLE